MAAILNCQCEHVSHFDDDPISRVPGVVQLHPYGIQCKYVIKVDYGLLICEDCEKVGHGLAPAYPYPRAEYPDEVFNLDAYNNRENQ